MQAVGIFVLRIVVRELAAEIAFAERAEDRIGQRMRRHVGIGMAPQAAVMRNLDTAEYQPASCFQRMEIEALANAKFI